MLTCDCGAISSVTNAWGTAVEQPAVFSFDYQGHQTLVQQADEYNVDRKGSVLHFSYWR